MWEKLIKNTFRKAGIKEGEDIVIHDNSAYKDFVIRGSLGFGESYMFKKWDSPHLDVVIANIIRSGIHESRWFGTLIHAGLWIKSTLKNLQNRHYAPLLAETHYNAGNHLFKSFLDPNMIYTCAYFKNTDDLSQAQLNKIKVVGNKLNLKPGEKVLDIGCGWGGTARILAEMFDVEVTGISDASEMVNYANKHNAGDRVKFIKTDYRNAKGRYNKIYNVGFLEAVGPKNYRRFMQQVYDMLEDDGIFLTHTIMGQKSTNRGDPWLDKYIFPNGVLPSHQQIKRSVKKLFAIRDFESFGHYYEITLDHWRSNLNKNWEPIKAKFDNPDAFKRMMDFYFLSCKAAFHTNLIDLGQYVFTKSGQVPGYKPFRMD